jgi:hypothetical protein
LEKPAVFFRIDQIFDLEEAAGSISFCHEHGGSRLIRNIRTYLTNYTASHSRRPQSMNTNPLIIH